MAWHSASFWNTGLRQLGNGLLAKVLSRKRYILYRYGYFFSPKHLTDFYCQFNSTEYIHLLSVVYSQAYHCMTMWRTVLYKKKELKRHNWLAFKNHCLFTGLFSVTWILAFNSLIFWLSLLCFRVWPDRSAKHKKEETSKITSVSEQHCTLSCNQVSLLLIL